MSDAQFVAREPDSPLVQAARRTLREIKAARPDFFVIAGDFVDEATEADFQLAKRILDEEIGSSVPYYYVPGNHEMMGAAITNFEKYFGATNRIFDHKGTRFVTLNIVRRAPCAAAASTRLAMLRSALDSAARDRTVSSVVVIEHHPPRDPTPAKNSQLADRHEAALVEDWLGLLPALHRQGRRVRRRARGHVPRFAGGQRAVPDQRQLRQGAGDRTSGGRLHRLDAVRRRSGVGGRSRLGAKRFPFQGGPDWLSAQTPSARRRADR